MISISLNIAGTIDPGIAATIAAVARVIDELGMPWVIVGATARDLVMHHGHRAPLHRKTRDVDFAIEVWGWPAFEAVKARLCAQGFQATQASHRLIDPAGGFIDIVPFGRVQDEETTIAWPPDGEIRMNLLGFQEACDHAQWVRLQENPALDVPVATPAGLVLLKLIAWMDRPVDQRRKDAEDLGYILSTYEEIPDIRDALYENENTDIMEEYGWDPPLAAARLLGRHAKAIARPETQRQIARLADGELQSLNLDRLAEEAGQDFDKQLLTAFMHGFSD